MKETICDAICSTKTTVRRRRARDKTRPTPFSGSSTVPDVDDELAVWDDDDDDDDHDGDDDIETVDEGAVDDELDGSDRCNEENT